MIQSDRPEVLATVAIRNAILWAATPYRASGTFFGCHFDHYEAPGLHDVTPQKIAL
jgi:hypothetical protein